MSEILKERVNFNKICFIFVFAILLSLCTSKNFAQDNQQPFDYTKTIWIINVIESSGTVYGRPKPEDYNPRQGLIYIYEILIKYVYSMQDLNTSSLPSSLTVTHELILINGIAERRLLIGDHWISDERNIAVMSEVDYNNLKEWLGTREKNQDYKQNPPIDKLVKAFRNDTSPDIESFDKYFHRNQIPSDTVKSQASTADLPKPLTKVNNAGSERNPNQTTNQNKIETRFNSPGSIDTANIKSSNETKNPSTASIISNSSPSKTQSKDENQKISIFFWLIVFCAPLFLFLYLKSRKR
jgi:hypothetical protein